MRIESQGFLHFTITLEAGEAITIQQEDDHKLVVKQEDKYINIAEVV